jgi:uracil-DNA glycosylase
MTDPLAAFEARYRACRICRDAPRRGPPLAHEPRPIAQLGMDARILIASQAPGLRAHLGGRPFIDPSGVRLRSWLGVDEAAFYDPAVFAILPMGGCFPGHGAKRDDLPPRPECAEAWREEALGQLRGLRLILLIGQYAMRWHLDREGRGEWAGSLGGTLGRWREILAIDRRPRLMPLPHPSWRNNGYLKRHPFIEAELIPALRAEVARALGRG